MEHVSQKKLRLTSEVNTMVKPSFMNLYMEIKSDMLS